jgi:transposase
MPNLFEDCTFSYKQLMSGLSFFGDNYDKIIELFTSQTIKKYGIDTSKTYFDCTNFYFEIDKEDSLRRKGPSKENRRDPIIGMGLILDANQIPIGMKLYPGNQSEKPILRDVINNLKRQNNITGKTVHVADKGLNCAENIVYSLKNNDGYIFSKSVKMLSEIEKQWVMLDNDWCIVTDTNGVVKYQYKSCIDEFPYTITDKNGKKKKVMIREKRLLTYNQSLAKKKKIEINRQVDKATNLCCSQAKKSEYGDSSKYVNFESVDKDGNNTGKKISVTLNQKMIEKDLKYAGYNLLVTSEIKMSDEDIYDTYHNLWRIEESFKIMKSDLDARPVYVRDESTIKGHFLICYLTVLLERILQFKEFNNEYSSNDIIKFIKKTKVVEGRDEYTNVTTNSGIILELAERLSLPLDNYKLSETNIRKVLNFRF